VLLRITPTIIVVVPKRIVLATGTCGLKCRQTTIGRCPALVRTAREGVMRVALSSWHFGASQELSQAIDERWRISRPKVDLIVPDAEVPGQRT
jgi:hypothetical protein